MLIKRTFPAWNPKGLGLPWAALVTKLEDHKPPDTVPGQFFGDPLNGGFVLLRAEPGDVIQLGQHSYSSEEEEARQWFTLNRSGQLLQISYATARILLRHKGSLSG
jgi:hypothetical protein